MKRVKVVNGVRVGVVLSETENTVTVKFITHEGPKIVTFERGEVAPV